MVAERDVDAAANTGDDPVGTATTGGRGVLAPVAIVGVSVIAAESAGVGGRGVSAGSGSPARAWRRPSGALPAVSVVGSKTPEFRFLPERPGTEPFAPYTGAIPRQRHNQRGHWRRLPVPARILCHVGEQAGGVVALIALLDCASDAIELVAHSLGAASIGPPRPRWPRNSPRTSPDAICELARLFGERLDLGLRGQPSSLLPLRQGPPSFLQPQLVPAAVSAAAVGAVGFREEGRVFDGEGCRQGAINLLAVGSIEASRDMIGRPLQATIEFWVGAAGDFSFDPLSLPRVDFPEQLRRCRIQFKHPSREELRKRRRRTHARRALEFDNGSVPAGLLLLP